MRHLKITLGILAILLGLSFHYIQIKTGLDFFAPQGSSPIVSANMSFPVKVNNAVGKHAIKVALLLDTSNSMDGLIEQAKSQLWNILNELSRAEKNGEDPNLEIALYEYGNPTKGRNQINQITPFTTDMDLISEKLFALSTNGGDEYCGQIIQTALNELDWGSNPADLKIIYIAGNEPFTQGPVNYAFACQQAQEKDITINTIFCGNYEEGINTSWKAGADLAKGIYMHIDHNQQTAYIETPYDQKINALNTKLNDTYIPYGDQGQRKKQNQVSQDLNASLYSTSNAGDRAAFKSSKKYKAEDWDLVDAYKKDKNIMHNVKILPDSLQNISIEEMEQRIQAVAMERETIQNEIQELDKKRRDYKAEQSSKKEEEGLQGSVINSIRKQAKEKGFEIKE